MRVVLAGACAVVLAVASLAAAKEAASPYGVGTTLTAGTGGYRRAALYGDALWRVRDFSPYALAEFSADSDVRQFSLLGGTWKDLGRAFRVKGGAGLNFGKVLDTDDATTSFTLETGAEGDIGDAVAGAEYRFTSGGIGGSRVIRSDSDVLRIRARGKASSAGVASVEPESFTYHELAGYGSLPLGGTSVSLKLALGIPSYSDNVVSETLTWKIPIPEHLWVAPSLSLEQGRGSNAYGSLGLYWAF
ncbi:MAG: hypothetical protein HY924_00150 [Elusimicrobia bacterium]|nr:hypothetical protein [Elusimicrobiota bacterium]